MFFLLRCSFWLGLVFLNMDWKIEGPLLPSGEDLARQASAQCLGNPQACAQVIAGAQDLVAAVAESRPAAEPRDAIQVAQKPEHRGEPKPAQKAAPRH